MDSFLWLHIVMFWRKYAHTYRHNVSHKNIIDIQKSYILYIGPSILMSLNETILIVCNTLLFVSFRSLGFKGQAIPMLPKKMFFWFLFIYFISFGVFWLFDVFLIFLRTIMGFYKPFTSLGYLSIFFDSNSRITLLT